MVDDRADTALQRDGLRPGVGGPGQEGLVYSFVKISFVSSLSWTGYTNCRMFECLLDVAHVC